MEWLDNAMVAVLRSKTPLERLEMLDGFFRSAQQLLRAAVVHAHPDWTQEQVEQEVARRIALDSD